MHVTKTSLSTFIVKQMTIALYKRKKCTEFDRQKRIKLMTWYNITFEEATSALRGTFTTKHEQQQLQPTFSNLSHMQNKRTEINKNVNK